jgi:hypothetical protein
VKRDVRRASEVVRRSRAPIVPEAAAFSRSEQMVPTSGELFTRFDPDPARFVQAYYEPLQRFLEGAFTAEAECELPMGDLPLVDVRLGLDLRAFAGITSGAPAIHDGSRTAGAASPEHLFVGPDAVAVGLGTSWSPTSMRHEPADRPS